MVHVNCGINYGGQTFSYILDIKMHNLVRTFYSQQLSLIRKVYKSLVYLINQDMSERRVGKG